MTPSRIDMAILNALFAAVDTMVEEAWEKGNESHLRPEEGAALKNLLRSFVMRGGSTAPLVVTLVDMGFTGIALGVAFTARTGADEEAPITAWAHVESRLARFKELTEELSRQKGDNSHEVQHQEGRRYGGSDGTVAGGGNGGTRDESEHAG